MNPPPKKSRHTVAAGRLTRSFGIIDDSDLVVEICDDGTVRLREEPVDRRLKRGEVLPDVVIDARAAWDNRKKEAPTDDVERRIDKVLARLPIADLSGNAEQVGYRAKVWLMAELKREFEE